MARLISRAAEVRRRTLKKRTAQNAKQCIIGSSAIGSTALFPK